MSDISPEELGERLQGEEDNLLVVDIRHQAEFDDWHVPSSVNVDVYDELAGDPTEAKEALSDLPEEKDIVTVCGAGIAAETATNVLEEMD